MALPRTTEKRVSMWPLYNKALVAKASTTEEPDAGKPHVPVCAGGAR